MTALKDFPLDDELPGGSLPAGFDVDDNATLTQTPVDQTGDSPFINLVYDPAQLVDESNLGLVMNVRPEGSTPGDGTDLFLLGVNVFEYHSAIDEGNANFKIKSQDEPSAAASMAVSGGGTASLHLLGLTGQVIIGSDGLAQLPNLPTADPLAVGQLWADASADFVLKVSQG